MQNLSFLAIIGALLSCAFFFSQQTKSQLQSPLAQETDSIDAKRLGSLSIEDIPDCTNLDSEEEVSACYTEAASLSQQLLDSKIDAILKMETNSQHRMDFMEVQLAWEDSRDSDCDFVEDMSDREEKATQNKLICLTDRNLDRYEQLQSYYCQWYDASICEDE
ncbi:MAG: lysozyme inhibitor LprI family protein [Chloroflexota bacterium]|jgi:uncharacterized protein YecT (DUF1311 family)|nr:lysozyme inhibitor LprI family protein [Chloroflexota bacterium]